MFSLIGTMVSGLVVGIAAKFLMPGKDPGGVAVTILLGIAGSFLGSWGGQAVGIYRAGEPAGFVMSVVGAIVLLFVYRTLKQSSA